ncbi:hypothetical protein ASE27_12350 [Oerskovia sp. Root918]|uniref:AMP-binding protein n=1 Tax=Oerskovia sp. Root918 TaxID=1736607 RepID=UPI0006FC44D3|nr:AMP-binding protein [Oerskovia sp. Root918]KRD36368.1 hypothetical protein ASE27_12350 [Oerskovia sp. Root918]
MTTVEKPQAHSLPRDLALRHGDRRPAVRRSRSPHAREVAVSWHLLSLRSLQLAARLRTLGVAAGDRVAVHLPTGPTRTAVVYACWHLGAVVVATTTGTTHRQRRTAYQLAQPRVVIADVTGLRAARGRPSVRARIAVGPLSAIGRAALQVAHRLADLPDAPRRAALPDAADPSADAAIVFTADADGQTRGIFYTHGEMLRLRDTVADQLVAADAAGSDAGYVPGALLLRTTRRGTALTAATLLAPGMPDGDQPATALERRLLQTWAREVTSGGRAVGARTGGGGRTEGPTTPVGQ